MPTMKVTLNVLDSPPIPAPPPMQFPFLFRSPIYPDRLYLRTNSHFRDHPLGSGYDVRLTDQGAVSIEIVRSGVSDADAWSCRLSNQEVVTLANTIG